MGRAGLGRLSSTFSLLGSGGARLFLGQRSPGPGSLGRAEDVEEASWSLEEAAAVATGTSGAFLFFFFFSCLGKSWDVGPSVEASTLTPQSHDSSINPGSIGAEDTGSVTNQCWDTR